MDSRTTPLILVMVALLLCAVIIPNAAGAILPGVITQQEEETSLGEDLTRSTISDINGGDDEEVNGRNANAEIVNQDSADTTATVYSNQEEDQTVDQTDFVEFGDNTVNLDTDQPAANVAIPLATPISVEEDDGENEVVWCYQRQGDGAFCFNTQEQCELALAEDELSTTSHCERFETLPPDAFRCVAEEGGISCIRES